MKNSKFLVTLLLIVLIVFGVFSALTYDSSGSKKEYNAALDKADEYMKRELYQMAIAEYDKAVAIEDSEKLRQKILDAYEKRYAESEKILESYIAAAESAVSAYPKNGDFYLTLSKAYTRDDNFQSAYKALTNAKSNGVKHKKLEAELLKAKYANETVWVSYSEQLSLSNDCYAVSADGLWGVVDKLGDDLTGVIYKFASGVGDEGIKILAGEQIVLSDSDDVVRGKLSFVPTAASPYSEGLIAIAKDDVFGFYDSLGDYKFGEYKKAGSFSGGKAPVCGSDGLWYFVDDKGKKIGDENYQDIRLTASGKCFVNDIMIAKRNGKYSIYNKKDKRVGSLECDDMGILVGEAEELIAFKKGDKWGFVDASGKEKIAPEFEAAKSFSNGLAAVCMDGKWGFIDTSGKVVIDYQFFDADYFNSEKYCMVKTKENEWQMLRLLVRF